MKHIKIAKLMQRLLVMLVITCVLCGDVMIASAQTTPVNDVSEGGEIEFSEETVEEAIVEDVAEEVVEESFDVELTETDAASGKWYDVKWSYSSGTLTITGSGEIKYPGASNYPWHEYKDSVTKVVIGDYVTSIGESAFSSMNNLTSVIIGSRVEVIRGRAFYKCANLKSVTIPSSVTTIAAGAFYGCHNVQTLTFGADSKLTFIYNEAFSNCSSLKKVVFPANLSTIGPGAFDNCTNLETIVFGNKLATIDERAFQNCSKLTSVNIPNTVVNIGEKAFFYCTALNKVTFAVGITSIGSYAFSNTAITTLKLPSTVTSIGQSAFSGCADLKEVTLGSGLTFIADYTFYGCSALTKVTMGDNIKLIGDNAFWDCKLLSTIIWPANLSKIGAYAFSNCDSLKIAKLPNSVETIGKSAFYSCDILTEVVLGESVTDIGESAFYSCPINNFTTYASDTVYDGPNIFTSKSSMTICGWPNSTAKTYASEQGISFKALSKLNTVTMKKVTNVVSGIHVYWNEVPGAATYNVYRSTSKDSGYAVIKSGIVASHFIDTTATSGKTYYYKVVAKHGTTTSALSDDYIGITYVGTPDITTRVNSGTGIKLGWNKISGATGYAIYRKPYEGSTWTRVATVSGNDTFTWTDTSVKSNNGTVYKYTIRALAGSDMKTLSGCRNTGRTMVRLSSQILNSAAKASSTSVKCSWTTSSVVTGYEVRFMVGSTVYKTVTIGNYKTGTKTFTDLKAGQNYKIQVRTYKKVEGVGSFYSAWSTAKYVKL